MVNTVKPFAVLGTMSGTSLDGVDAAVLHTDGQHIIKRGDYMYRPYTLSERTTIRSALGLWDRAAAVLAAEAVVQKAHQELIARFFEHNIGIDLIGMHGQTLAHAPTAQGTHQIGNGVALAAFTDCPVVWDFRSRDIRAGGQGAPLAPLYHYALVQEKGTQEPIAILNLGGIANITWVDPMRSVSEGGVLAFDIGPANAPMDDIMLAHTGQNFDPQGQTAAQGTANRHCVDICLQHPFFSRKPPKSLCRNDLAALVAGVYDLPLADALATLVAVIVGATKRALAHCPAPVSALWVTGGGRLNAFLMASFCAAMPCPVLAIEQATSAKGLNGDAIEAEAFAFLAMRTLRGLSTSVPMTTGASTVVSGGVIAWPP